MATRMQQRKGTAEQWSTVNPVLAPGEIGWESDTNQFKIGDGINSWSSLSYFLDETSLAGSLSDYVEVSLLGVPDGVATLDSSGKLTSSQLPDVQEITEDLVNGVLVAGNGITKTYDDNAGTLTIAADTSILATKAELAEVSQDSVNDALVAGTGITKVYNDAANTITVSADTDVLATKTYADQAETDAKSYADSLAVNYDPAGSATSAQTAAETFATNAINALDTDDIEEGANNKYYSDTLARGAVSAGEGLDYNSTTGAFSADLGNGLQFDANGQIEIDVNIVATDTDLSTAVSTHSGLTTGIHGVTGNVVGTSDIQTLTNKVIGSGTTLSANIDAEGFKITDLGVPTDATDAATKGYVDSVAEGLHVHASVVALADSNISLPTTPATVDGVTLSVNDRVLLIGQTAKAENGIYVVINGDLARAADYNTAGEIDPGDFVFVSGGTVYGSTGWVQKNTITTLGTDPIEWSQFSGTGTYDAGTGLTLTGTTFAVNTETIATKSYVDGELDAHVDLSTGVHGITGSVVGTSDTQTLTSKTLGTGTVLGANLDGANTYKVTNLQDPTSNQDAATKAYVDAGLSGKQGLVSGVSDTEIGYLDGVTSSIQTQIDGKANTSHTHTTSDITNFDITSPADGSFLKYNSTTSKWEDAIIIDGGNA